MLRSNHLIMAVVGLACLAGGTACGRVTVYVHAVRVGDENGSNQAYPSPEAISASLANASAVYGPDANIEFRLAAVTDLRNDRINRLSYTDPGCVITTEDYNEGVNATRDYVDANPARFAGQIVVFYRYWQLFGVDNPSDRIDRTTCSNVPVLGPDGSSSICMRCKPTTNFSGTNVNFVAMSRGTSDPYKLGHEIGHYFGLKHTHGPAPANDDELRAIVTAYLLANPTSPGRNALDGDLSTPITDTPADPGVDHYLWKLGVTNKCSGAGSYSVPISQGITYTFAPDRENVMSYFLCSNLPSGRATLTRDQVNRVHAVLTSLRFPLLDYTPPSTSLVGARASVLQQIGLPEALRLQVKTKPHDPLVHAAVCAELKTHASYYLSRASLAHYALVSKSINECDANATRVQTTWTEHFGKKGTKHGCPATP